ncbi:hypothetical protein COX05_02100 [candidate division WWE3 bacterium CG22_combo_CG10-13_8_21_14_all_39_12]|uniref:Uncharacterized protein n=2 Tax=Katanobacteria TaxID=422282 RepID=A0A2M7WZX0_UNCKA|nr:MAG: hypothetical protein COX05_02100 [candidate division WWE3 bacterium CG22_combo_CG10-13_8_21_14_all_39_12]PJA39273.1 MAG: hypothetical protein CO179_05550 [candidate division WWE3 bacterium CG_4_9_14_3_um_filter_39_7]
MFKATVLTFLVVIGFVTLYSFDWFSTSTAVSSEPQSFVSTLKVSEEMVQLGPCIDGLGVPFGAVDTTGTYYVWQGAVTALGLNNNIVDGTSEYQLEPAVFTSALMSDNQIILYVNSLKDRMAITCE